jgi:peptidoglycan DL-endopeptidase CwlO
MLKQRQRLVPCVVLLLTFATLLLLPVSASADKLSDQKARAREILAQLETLGGQMEVAVEHYNAANGELDTVNQKIKENERNLLIARYNLTVAKDVLKLRAVSMYKQRPIDMLDVLFATRSFNDLVSQLDMLNRIGQNDSDVVDSIQGFKTSIVKAEDQLKGDRQEAQTLVAKRTAEKQTIEAALAKRKAMLAGVEKQIDALQRAQSLASQNKSDPNATLPGGNPSAPANSGAAGIAAQYLGIPYKYGGASPSTGFDCSGLTMYVYAQLGISLPHNAAAQYSSGAPVSRENLQPGDLVFFGSPIHHVGIYTGGGQMIHAPQTGYTVCYSPLLSDYVGACRP